MQWNGFLNPMSQKYTRRLRFGRCARVFGVILVASLLSSAQTFRGGLRGTVVDASSAVVANAGVQATKTATGIAYATISSSAGEFVFEDLPAGVYNLAIRKQTGQRASLLSFSPNFGEESSSYSLPLQHSSAQSG